MGVVFRKKYVQASNLYMMKSFVDSEILQESDNGTNTIHIGVCIQRSSGSKYLVH